MPDRLLTGIALSPTVTEFAPLLFAGRLEQGLETAAELGFDRVELSIRAVDDVDRRRLEQRLARLELRVSAIATGQACLTDGACLAGGAAGAHERAVERLLAAIELARLLGASVIVGGIRGRLTGTSVEQAQQRRRTVEGLRRCAAAAEDAGVTLLLEPINRYETNFVNTTAEGLELLDAVGDGGMKLLLDTFHMNIEEADPNAALVAAGGRLGYLHVVDSNRRAPGQGHIDFRRLLATLRGLGYGGAAIAEILPHPDDETAASQTAQFWSRLDQTEPFAPETEATQAT